MFTRHEIDSLTKAQEKSTEKMTGFQVVKRVAITVLSTVVVVSVVNFIADKAEAKIDEN